ncbi:hypothetical protein PFISCL1PPCAC_2758, partial [Pristionchus fissidentatus]
TRREKEEMERRRQWAQQQLLYHQREAEHELENVHLSMLLAEREREVGELTRDNVLLMEDQRIMGAMMADRFDRREIEEMFATAR